MICKKSNQWRRQVLLNFYCVQKLLNTNFIRATSQQVNQFQPMRKTVWLNNISHLILQWLAYKHDHEEYDYFSRCNRRQPRADLTLRRIILLKLLADLIKHLGQCLFKRSLFYDSLTILHKSGLTTLGHIKMLILLQFFKHLMLLSFIFKSLHHLFIQFNKSKKNQQNQGYSKNCILYEAGSFSKPQNSYFFEYVKKIT